MRLKNKVAIITGAATGIGLAACKRFLQEGAKVAMCDANKERLENAHKEIASLGEAATYAVDITDTAALENMVNSVKSAWGRVDILVNNAGITGDAQFYKMSEEQFDRVMEVNLKGSFRLTKLVVPIMMEQKAGRIIFASSVSAFNGNFGQTNYAASKAALIGMTRVMATELGKYNITVNAVAPGSILTDMYNAVPEEAKQKKLMAIPMRRYGLPEEAASVYFFLASDDASYVTGQTIVCDGGFN
ncbi:3-oxoacyl-ACP reductase FabG [Clostridia bacterium OttesenSCG-928-F22]|nr:3-oxoacyl-ACP reductase FabG [Clostridia bacterium OttesenSCG-928-F22]